MQAKNWKIKIAALCLCVGLAGTCPAKVIYVDDDATGANDGTSWEDAFFYLQDALMFAAAGDEIRVAQGVYRPDDFVLSRRPNLGREETFHLENGVTIKGGYAGLAQPDPDARDIQFYETILSGDRDGNDMDVNDLADLLDEPTRSENSYHVVTGSGCDTTAILDGFTITGGNANGAWLTPHQFGGGTLNNSGSPTLVNCTFTCNSAKRGGGVYNDGSSPTFTNCTFISNSALGYGCGGGICNWFDCKPVLTNCKFSGNFAIYYGGGMSQDIGSNSLLIKCTFHKNSAKYIGGIWVGEESSFTLVNCTLSGNRAMYTGGLAVNNSSLTLINCIFWGDVPNEISAGDSTVLVNYSDIQGGWPGQGNIGADPCFADANSGDYHLKSQAGRWDANDGRWVMDEVTSPCIDAGDPMSAVGNEPFPNGGIVNMGAYGGTAEASKSYFGKPPCEIIVAGDINGDCKINFLDFRLMALHWMEGHD